MAKDIDQTPAGRRDRGLGADSGQPGAQPQKGRTQPNKSAMGAKDAPPHREPSLDGGARPTISQSDRKNLGKNMR